MLRTRRFFLSVTLVGLAFAAPPLSAQHRMYTLAGPRPGDQVGEAVASAGDVDGDLFPDLLIAATEHDNGRRIGPGRALVISGRTFLPIHELRDAGSRIGDHFGVGQSIRDLDGDGRPEILIGAHEEDANGEDAGAAYLFSGRTGTRLYRRGGAAAMDHYGIALGAADANGDGHQDLLIAANLNDCNGPDSGIVEVISGEWLRAQILGQPAQTPEVLRSLCGAAASRFGSEVAGLGDLDGDGADEIAVGAPDHSGTGPGSAHVYSGGTGALLARWNGIAVGDEYGESIASAGDVDGDGTDDVVVGAPGASNGYAQVVSGRWIASRALPQILHTFSGRAAGDRFGRSVGGAGDFDADGRADVVVGAPGDSQTPRIPGYARVYSGRTGLELFRFDGTAIGDLVGWSVAGAGDVNRDGHADILVGAPHADGNAGRAWLFSYSYARLGDGCRGSVGVPTLSACPGSRPLLGGTFCAQIVDVPANVLEPVFMLIGVTRYATPLPLCAFGACGCFLWVDPIDAVALTKAGNTARWNVAIPNTPALRSARFYTQGVVADPPANLLGLTTSNAAVGAIE